MKKYHIVSEDGNIYNTYCGFELMKIGASKRTVSKPLNEWLALSDFMKCQRCKKKLEGRNQ